MRWRKTAGDPVRTSSLAAEMKSTPDLHLTGAKLPAANHSSLMLVHFLQLNDLEKCPLPARLIQTAVWWLLRRIKEQRSVLEVSARR